MAELQICLFGSFSVSRDFIPVPPLTWRTPHAASLLKLVLVRRPERLTVAEAAAVLGHGATAEAVRTALRHLEAVLGEFAALSGDAEERIHFKPGPRCWFDLDSLQAHYRSGLQAAARGDMLPAILAFQEADALYQGDLLEETQEPWVQEPRRRFQAIYTEILDHLAEGHAVLGRYADAVGFCHKALSHEPLREVTFQRMMVYYYYLGDKAGMRDAYRTCREALEGAGRRISSETVALWERLTQKGLPPSGSSQAAATSEDSSPASA